MMMDQAASRRIHCAASHGQAMPDRRPTSLRRSKDRAATTVYRLFLRFFAGATALLPLQNRIICLWLSAIIEAVCRCASAVAALRAAPSMVFAPLSHMLMNGFFFNQGFFTLDAAIER